jgi:hypothetical protein
VLECYHSMFRESYRSLRDRASRRYLRFLKRQLSLLVSMMSQWWVSRSRSAVVILLSPNTVAQSAKARLVVTTLLGSATGRGVLL